MRSYRSSLVLVLRATKITMLCQKQCTPVEHTKLKLPLWKPTACPRPKSTSPIDNFYLSLEIVSTVWVAPPLFANGEFEGFLLTLFAIFFVSHLFLYFLAKIANIFYFMAFYSCQNDHTIIILAAKFHATLPVFMTFKVEAKLCQTQ